MFKRIFVEAEIKNHAHTQKILNKFPSIPVRKIDRIDKIFGQVKKPYLQKRTNLNLFIGKKRGTLVKKAPNAYGVNGDPHYYFIHAYNCPYECQYCYLQGYFHSPDMVFFVNHQDIAEEIKKIAHKEKNKSPWFHAGEFSDSLVFSHVTQELPFYFDLFKSIPWAFLELRTKSANINPLVKLAPVKNIIVSYSLAPETQIKQYDNKTPSLQTRLRAIKKLTDCGHSVGIHLDPIIYQDNLMENYKELLNSLLSVIPQKKIKYISLGVVRFTKGVYRQVEKNYPASALLAQNFTKENDGITRYSKSIRQWIFHLIKDICISAGISQNKIYLCMEE
ncbi:MAG: radical SAM protein [Halobacteriovoraceae bacterium]|nr:radical SAM protein [Halobacteriovoraceae bacterium]